MNQLTEHFTLDELYKSDIAVRKGILNKPTPAVVQNLVVLANGLEQVRQLLGQSIMVTSGYRCKELNTLIRGAKDSAHMAGFAADFVSWSYGTPETIVHIIRQSQIKFDQLIMEGGWVHISFAPTMRQEVLTALFDEKGNPSYIRGSKP